MSDSDNDEPLSLNMDTLAALQSVMGGDADGGLAQLLQSRRLMQDDTSSEEDEDEDGDGMQEGESHADYYRRLYPERYASSAKNNTFQSKDSMIEHPVALITMDDEYVQKLILSAFAKRPQWKVLTTQPIKYEENSHATDGDTSTSHENYHFHWGEYEHIDWFSPSFTSEQTVVSCYYNRKGMIRKGNLAAILEKWQSKYKGIKQKIAPKSYVLRIPISSKMLTTIAEKGESTLSPTNADMYKEFCTAFETSVIDSGFPGFYGDHIDPKTNTKQNQLNREMSLEPNQVFILKPSVTNQANGISLVRSQTQLQQAISKSDALQLAGDFVLQEYIPPLLLDKRKFHLRVFMLLHGNVTAYIHPDFLAIFSLEPYENANLDNTRAHLTNIAHQQVLSLDDQHKCMRRFDETKQDMIDAQLVSSMEEATDKIENVKSRVYDIVAEMVEACTSELTFVCKTNCFELFGLDFMIDPDWNTWLLEANAEPDLSKAGDRLQCVIDQMLEETAELVIDSDPRFGDAGEDIKTSFVKVFEKKGRSF